MELENYFEFINNKAIRIRGTRVGIETILRDYQQGASPEETVLLSHTLSRTGSCNNHLLFGESGKD